MAYIDYRNMGGDTNNPNAWQQRGEGYHDSGGTSPAYGYYGYSTRYYQNHSNWVAPYPTTTVPATTPTNFTAGQFINTVATRDKIKQMRDNLVTLSNYRVQSTGATIAYTFTPVASVDSTFDNAGATAQATQINEIATATRTLWSLITGGAPAGVLGASYQDRVMQAADMNAIQDAINAMRLAQGASPWSAESAGRPAGYSDWTNTGSDSNNATLSKCTQVGGFGGANACDQGSGNYSDSTPVYYDSW
jgi:hypothetical protein